MTLCNAFISEPYRLISPALVIPQSQQYHIVYAALKCDQVHTWYGCPSLTSATDTSILYVRTIFRSNAPVTTFF